jgi:phosphoribosyl-AMP cyclohydrolase
MSSFPARADRTEIELGSQFQPKFGPDGMIPCIAQDHATGEVLMFAFMNAESLGRTLQTGKATYWSRSRNKLWMKGEESGNVQLIKEVRTDCDQDVILIKVERAGAANASCHNGYQSCFYRKLTDYRNPAYPLETTSEPLFDPKDVYSQ